MGTIESVKTADAVYANLAGTVLEVNEAINDTPEILNTDAEGDGWIAKLKIHEDADFSALLDKAAYDKWCEEDHHTHH